MSISLTLFKPLPHKDYLYSTAVLLFKSALVLSIIAVLGGASSWYFVQSGSRISVQTYGPWQTWSTVGQTDMDPYTKAHFLLEGSLPFPSDVAETYYAKMDTEGRLLHSSCDYKIESNNQSFLLWSLAVFTSEGKVIKNPAHRFSYTNKTAALDENGRFFAMLSQMPHPGNWLPTEGAGHLVVVYTVLSSKQKYELKPLDYLPQFQRLSCS